MNDFSELIRSHTRPLQPIETNVEPRLQRLSGVRAVLFDIYGTLLVSTSGDIGLTAAERRSTAIRDTAVQFGLQLTGDAGANAEVIQGVIRGAHESAREQGVPHPEVDIVAVWRETLPQIVAGPTAKPTAKPTAGSTTEPTTDATADLLASVDFERFALEYELRINPVWPMPEAMETVRRLRDSGLVLGIVSNAQFFTPLLFPALIGNSLRDMGFSPELTYFSYEHLQAKPGAHLFELAREELARQQISETEAVYVGNDMLNDVMAAGSIGFRTALFAGDQRSLRWRGDDPRVGGIQPDIVITSLSQLSDCLSP